MNSKQVNIKKPSMFALAAVLAVSLGATSAASAAVKCKPNVRVINQKGASIKVLNFKYQIGTSTIHTEGLNNKIVVPSETENWPSQRLSGAANGVVITSSAVEFKDDTGSGYGPPRMSSWFPHSFVCGSTRNYIHTIE